MSSEVNICNRALQLVGANTINSFGDGTTEANLCARNYGPLRDAVTSAYEWGHARRRYANLTPLAHAPAFEYSFQYLIDPANVLRIYWVGTDPAGKRELDDYQIEGKTTVLCNVGEGLKCKTINRVTDTTQFLPLFEEALVARIAAEFAIPLAESKTLQQQHFSLYNAKVDEAATVDALQGRNQQTRVPEDVRYRHGRYSSGFHSFQPDA